MYIALGKMSLHSKICIEKAVAYMGPHFIFSPEEDKELQQIFLSWSLQLTAALQSPIQILLL